MPGKPHPGCRIAGHLARHALSQAARFEAGATGRTMSRRQEVALWGSIAVLALAALGSVVRHQSNSLQRRVAIQVAPQPARGEALFRDKGCEGCHGAGGVGGQRGPALRQSPTLATLPRLVAAMWNHAPRMWQSMQAEHVPYPALDNEDAGQLVAYLYLSGHADDSGDAARGRQVFVQKQCVRCHDGGSSRG